MNNRIFFGTQGLLLNVAKNPLISPSDKAEYFLYGVQSIGINTTQEVTTVKNIGKSQRFDDIYLEPSNEITLERILSNQDKLWLELGSQFLYNASGAGLTYANSYLLHPDIFGASVGAWGDKTSVRLKNMPEYNLSLITTDEDTTVLTRPVLTGATSPTGIDSQGVIYLPGCLVNSISYDLSAQDFFRESVSLSNKIRYKKPSDLFDIVNLRNPNNPNHIPQLLKRQNIYNDISIYPYTVKQLTDFNKIVNGQEVFSITSINIELNLSYVRTKSIGTWYQFTGGGTNPENDEDKTNWFTSLSLPVEVNCTFTITAKNTEIFNIENIITNFVESSQTGSNQTICIVAGVPYVNGGNNFKFFVWNLGSKNRLISFNKTGGGTDGGLVEYEVTYRNTNNDFVTYTKEQVGSSSPGLFSQSTESY